MLLWEEKKKMDELQMGTNILRNSKNNCEGNNFIFLTIFVLYILWCLFCIQESSWSSSWSSYWKWHRWQGWPWHVSRQWSRSRTYSQWPSQAAVILIMNITFWIWSTSPGTGCRTPPWPWTPGGVTSRSQIWPSPPPTASTHSAFVLRVDYVVSAFPLELRSSTVWW